jgi:hypothetical protein
MFLKMTEEMEEPNMTQRQDVRLAMLFFYKP